MNLLRILLFAFALMPAVSLADTMDDEIDYLIGSVGRDGCTFIRNNMRYSGREAREHLRSKRERNAQLIGSTEEFIEKIASGSSTSGRPYLIRCRRQQQLTANEWFTALLEEHRDSG
ncbi:MAG: DUF5329 family protein [Gammaproteobacteria bacterium]|jgi:hypothetical protein|nr:hypothetical protein [Gammaproteobacteria bacterium]MDP6096111.1 DUF5329 family protein [Gammaproteobacteria bacterium]MDP7154500.1 DUF5329 family protein [Gammaproteobacteria bacterium]HJO10955.1 DUF5329 family protein [Gammaproteobacteria bacterium]|tara:strand:+ start:163 stop:513 length:351 start_codon:yes stop_codon:yes gene_type:complete